MSKLIAVVGNVGVGKTTFTEHLCAATGYVAALEDHATRSFHAAFATDRRVSALANQVDFLIGRAEQEQQIRAATTHGVQDGGLEQDFWVFTRFFAAKGYLSTPEHALCERLYRLARQTLPPPDVLIHLTAPLHTLATRHAQRKRAVEVVRAADIPLLEDFVHAWLARTTVPILRVDTTAADTTFAAAIAQIGPALHTLIG